MGSFWGHIDEGLFFILLASWWMFSAFREYIMAQSQGQMVRPNISYAVKIRRPIPLETVFKILFPIVGIMGELLDGGIRFQDANGNFVKLVYQQHMTIYGSFILHGIIDLLTWFKFPLFPSLDYVSASIAFAWYGIAFFYHASMHGKAAVETAVHILPIYVMFSISIAVLLEHSWRQGVWTVVVRAYGILTLGTWFSHVSFMLYVSDRFPGGQASNLDRTDPNNVVYVKAMFGMHLFVNLIITLVLYVIAYFTIKVRFGIHLHSSKYFQEEDQECLPVYKSSMPAKPLINGYSHKKSSSPNSKTRAEDGATLELLSSADDFE